MAAAKSSLAKKRNLSLDLMAATKENEERLKVWTTLSDIDKNGKANISNKSAKPSGLHLYLSNKKERNEIPKEEVNNTHEGLQTQSSEMRKTWYQKFVSWRYCMVLLLQSSFVVGMFLRNCLPMAMVCMVRPRSGHLFHSHGSLNRTGNEAGFGGITFQPVIMNVSVSRNDTHDETTDYEFHWSPEVQGLVLTSIMFSTFMGPLAVTIVKERLGIKLTMSVMNIFGSLLTFLSPTAARISPYCLVVLRLILGVSMGGTVTVVGESIAWWAPQDEKLTMVALSFTGVNIGTVLASFLSGYLCLMPWDNGWPFVFYTFGAASLIWGICWHFLSSPKPEEHPYISEKEKQYIISHRVGMDTPTGKKTKPPYLKVITSVPVLAYFAAGTCHMWATQVLFTYLPTFFNKQMKFAVQETGLLTSLTSLFRMLGSFWWTVLGNKTAPSIGTNRSRKLCICVGFALTSASTITVGFFDNSYRWVVLGLLIFLMINQSVGTSTITALPLDMAPRYAGLLTGMYMSLGSLLSISGPLLTAAITANGTHEEWLIIWITMSCIFLMGAIIFLLCGNATLQPWAHGKETDAPNIVSPFVTMGRRFSTFIEAPPLSPNSPTEKRFEFLQRPQTDSERILAQIASTSPEVFYAGNYDLAKTESSGEIVGKTGRLNDAVEFSDEIDNSSSNPNISNPNISNTNFENTDNDITNEQSNPVRLRAFSEFGLEVLRSKITLEIDAENSDREDRLFSEHLKSLQEKYNTVFVKEQSDQINTTGLVNKSYEDTEDKIAVQSDDVQTSYL